MDDVTTRPARERDLPAVARLRWQWVVEENGGTPALDRDAFVEAFTAWAHEHAATHASTVLVRSGAPGGTDGDDDGEGERVVGMAWLAVTARVPSPRSLERTTADVQCVYVEPAERGRGGGSLLLEAVLRDAAAAGVERVVVHSSERAVPVYERAGFASGRRLLHRPPVHQAPVHQAGTVTAHPADPFPPEPHDGVEHLVLDAVPLAVVRHPGVRLEQLPQLFGPAFGALGGLTGSGALVPAGPFLAVYRGDVSGVFDLEVGVPLHEPLPAPLGAGDVVVVPSGLPAGPAAAMTHVGAYDGLGRAWGELAERAPGRPSGTSVEVYVSDSTAPVEELRTDLLLLLRP